MQRHRTRMFNDNRFKLGLFASNCSSGLTMTRAPERWDASWDNNLAAAKLADAAGLEFLLPVARWQGYGGETDPEGSALETITWATGLLGATEGVTVFGTVHVAFIHPVFAAKQIVTADHIGHGRFGLNVVSGGNAGEARMFGGDLREHDERYAYTEEWVTIVKRVWAEHEPFDFQGKFFQLERVVGKPKPYGGERPLLLSAGSSNTGRAFAVRHADCLFMVIIDETKLADEIAAIRALAPRDRRFGVYASGHMVCRSTQKQADEYYHYIVHEMGDWEAVDFIIGVRKESQSFPPEKLQQMRERFLSGTGTFPVVGSPDTVVQKFKALADAGLDGMAIGLVNYIDDFALLRDEVLPRMQRAGLRQPRHRGTA
jgi:alkanesulfonate monooxygenase SsuD/methylene tetrahydromethanopterin reductase-like flavin-dependent oxidoreductase (luciferase family)